MSATPYLVVGNTGAGKSTFARDLSKKESAHIFSVDEWMKTLFLMDMPSPPSYEWALERTERIEDQMLQESFRLLKNGMNIILDIGFFARKQRNRVISALKSEGFTPVVYFLDIDKETRWQRVHQRNTQQTETYQFEVSKEIFEFCETIFEPLDETERKTANIIQC